MSGILVDELSRIPYRVRRLIHMGEVLVVGLDAFDSGPLGYEIVVLGLTLDLGSWDESRLDEPVNELVVVLLR